MRPTEGYLYLSDLFRYILKTTYSPKIVIYFSDLPRWKETNLQKKKHGIYKRLGLGGLLHCVSPVKLFTKKTRYERINV